MRLSVPSAKSVFSIGGRRVNSRAVAWIFGCGVQSLVSFERPFDKVAAAVASLIETPESPVVIPDVS